VRARTSTLFPYTSLFRSGGGEEGVLAVEDEFVFVGTHVADFHEGDAGDAEEVGGVGGEEIGLDDAEDLENQGGGGAADADVEARSEEHTSELQSRENLVCRLL